MAFHVCIEGADGTYKTTTCKKLFDHYTKEGFNVLLTKEPGTSNVPSTQKLREIMLSNQYDDELTPISRELISQAIRSIHMNWLDSISDNYDLIIQDRGILSGRYYAEACGIPTEHLDRMEHMIGSDNYEYGLVLILQNENGLQIAKHAKNEFGVGDAMESRGQDFHSQIEQLFDSSDEFEQGVGEIVKVKVVGLTPEEVLSACEKEITPYLY